MAAIRITEEKLLIVEGNDEVSVFGKIFEHLSINNVQIIECGGNIQFKSKFPSLIKSSGFSDVTSFAVIQDADNDALAAFQRVQHVLSVCQQPVPREAGTFVAKDGVQVGAFILPGANLPGMLEDLYLQTLEGSPVLECVDSCVGEMRQKCPPTDRKNIFGIPLQREAKIRTLGTLMATSGPHNRLGHAAKDGYWDLSHPAMESLFTFLKQL